MQSTFHFPVIEGLLKFNLNNFTIWNSIQSRAETGSGVLSGDQELCVSKITLLMNTHEIKGLFLKKNCKDVITSLVIMANTIDDWPLRKYSTRWVVIRTWRISKMLFAYRS